MVCLVRGRSGKICRLEMSCLSCMYKTITDSLDATSAVIKDRIEKEWTEEEPPWDELLGLGDCLKKRKGR